MPQNETNLTPQPLCNSLVVAASSKSNMSIVPTPNAQGTWGYVDTTTDKVTISPAPPFCEAVFVLVYRHNQSRLSE